MESSAFSEPANYTILKRELQITVQGISEYLRSSAGQAISPTVLSERDFAKAKRLDSASAAGRANRSDLPHTLIELPIADATQRIQQQFSLLPMVKAMQAEESALLLRIQALRNKMLLSLFWAVVIVLWYFIACFFIKVTQTSRLKSLVNRSWTLPLWTTIEICKTKSFCTDWYGQSANKCNYQCSWTYS